MRTICSFSTSRRRARRLRHPHAAPAVRLRRVWEVLASTTTTTTTTTSTTTVATRAAAARGRTRSALPCRPPRPQRTCLAGPALRGRAAALCTTITSITLTFCIDEGVASVLSLYLFCIMLTRSQSHRDSTPFHLLMCRVVAVWRTIDFVLSLSFVHPIDALPEAPGGDPESARCGYGCVWFVRLVEVGR